MLGLLHGTTVPDYKGTKFIGNWVNLGGKKRKKERTVKECAVEPC